MTDPINMWDTIIEDGVSALDFRPVAGDRSNVLLIVEVGVENLHSNVVTAAHAAMEVDKLIAFDLADPEARNDLKQATAELLDLYRIELARAVRRAAGDEPGTMLAALGSPHE